MRRPDAFHSKKIERVASQVGISRDHLRENICRLPGVLSSIDKKYCQRDMLSLVSSLMDSIDTEINLTVSEFPSYVCGYQDVMFGDILIGNIPEVLLIIAALDLYPSDLSQSIQINNIAMNFGSKRNLSRNYVKVPGFSTVKVRVSPDEESMLYHSPSLANIRMLISILNTSSCLDPIAMECKDWFFKDEDLTFGYINLKTGRPSLSLKNPGHRVLSKIEQLKDTIYHEGCSLARRIRHANRLSVNSSDLLRLATTLEALCVLSRGIFVGPEALKACARHLSSFTNFYLDEVDRTGQENLFIDMQSALMGLAEDDDLAFLSDSVDWELFGFEEHLHKKSSRNSSYYEQYVTRSDPPRKIPREETIIDLKPSAKPRERVSLVRVKMNDKCIPKVISDLKKIGVHIRIVP